MCGRFTLTTTLEEIANRYDLEVTDIPTNYVPTYNAAPSQRLLGVIHDGLRRRAGYFSWGLIPRWSKDAKIANQTINARSETITEKPAFKESFQRRRTIIPVDGVYEWMQTSYGKQPMRIVIG
ncbi:SOS response-associated peptidase [Paenibacillus frigoriresistens]|uniref:SOS response-associated peptidase n=1 Tax=Paenibacillus alginolyticus TaxID=59839 RepID=UPI0015640068|nr:SOS response-associated peptidase [Paenibacillus frigoriresistens]NRF95115.1 SOS response-associated peptidase [Paenibacillus frigoriresistens]